MSFSPIVQQFSGVLQCGRYAFRPNFYGYCGPDKNSQLFEYCSADYYEPVLNNILDDFEVMAPYLRLIARNNRIEDIYDPRVVEAYWLGNQYTEGVNIKQLYRHFTEDKNLKSKLPKDLAEKVLGLIPDNAKPHHNFHVVNIWLRAGKLNISHTLKSIDECRISWGKVKNIKKSSLMVEFQPLVIVSNKIQIGQPIEREVVTHIEDKSFIREIEIGDLVTIHWGWVCERINEEQLKYLKKYTVMALNIFNCQSNY